MKARKPKAKATPTRPRVGDEAWIVEWCVDDGPVDEAGEYDPYAAVYETRAVATRERAEQVAREVYPLDQRGSVRYWPAQFEPYDPDDAAEYPHAGRWVETGEAQYYEGEEGADS